MTAPTVLDSLPRLGGLYARALGRQVQTVVARGSKLAALPEAVYRVDGVRVDPEHLTTYQHLLGERASDELPAGFVHVVVFPLAVAIMARPDFPLPLLGMVHVSNEVTQTRGLRADSILSVRAWSEGLAAHRSGTQVDLVVEVSDEDGPAWRGVSTYLARGVRIPDLPDAPQSDRDSGDHPAPTAVWDLPGDIGREYAKVSGDINPIHTSSLGAKALGFPRAIAHGMYTASQALAEVGPAKGEAFTWTVEFAAPVLLPGRVSLSITGAPESGFAYRGWGRKLNFTGRVRPL